MYTFYRGADTARRNQSGVFTYAVEVVRAYYYLMLGFPFASLQLSPARLQEVMARKYCAPDLLCESGLFVFKVIAQQ